MDEEQDKAPAPYQPNRVPLHDRIVRAVVAAVIFSYGLYGIVVGDLVLPSKMGHRIHLHGLPALLAFAAMAFAAANLVSMIFDHYDTRNNEERYRRFAKVTSNLAWTCLLLSAGLTFAGWGEGVHHP